MRTDNDTWDLPPAGGDHIRSPPPGRWLAGPKTLDHRSIFAEPLVRAVGIDLVYPAGQQRVEA